MISFQSGCVSEATVSRFLRDIRHGVEVDEMCAKVVQEVKVTPAVKDMLDVKVTEEVNAAESDHASFPAGSISPKVRLYHYHELLTFELLLNDNYLLF